MVSTIVANMRTIPAISFLTTSEACVSDHTLSSSEWKVPLYRDYKLSFLDKSATSVVKALVIATPFSFEVICLSRTYMLPLRLGEE
jgi:hypothetical protein